LQHLFFNLTSEEHTHCNLAQQHYLNLMQMNKINVQEKLSLFNDHWNPRIIAELNGQHVKVAKFQGEFIWHKHASLSSSLSASG